MLEITKMMNVEKEDESTPLLRSDSVRRRSLSSTRTNEAGLCLTILISLLTAGVMVLILTIMGQSHRYDITNNAPRHSHKHHHGANNNKTTPHVIEMATFQLNKGVKCVDFVDHAQALQDFFASRRAMQRSLAFQTANYKNGMYHGCDNNNNTATTTTRWVDLVYWESMEEALQAAKDILVDETAQPFLQSINASTLTLQHFSIDMDWRPWQRSLYVEVALFELVSGITKPQFLQDANATTPFFENTPAAKRRILSQGYEFPNIWLDLVYWASVEEAKEAAIAIEKFAPARPFLDDMNVTSPTFQFDYYQVGLWQDFTKQQQQQTKKRRKNS